jgi:hypothetical protein
MKVPQHAIRNRSALEASKACGCYFCLKVYSPSEITEWTDGDQTAICPHCHVDSVLPDALDISPDKLKQHHEEWFGKWKSVNSTKAGSPPKV